MRKIRAKNHPHIPEVTVPKPTPKREANSQPTNKNHRLIKNVAT